MAFSSTILVTSGSSSSTILVTFGSSSSLSELVSVVSVSLFNS